MKFKNQPNITVTGLVQGKIYDKPCLFPSNNIEVSCIFSQKNKPVMFFGHHLWCFPEIGLPPVIIHFRWGFSTINHPAMGVPPFVEPPHLVPAISSRNKNPKDGQRSSARWLKGQGLHVDLQFIRIFRPSPGASGNLEKKYNVDAWGV